MNLSAPFVHRPVMTTILMVGLVAFGLAAYRFLPISELPQVDFPTVVVTAKMPGASARTMASSVATPLEREFSAVSGIDSMVSTSVMGQTTVTLQFDLARNIDAAAQDVQSAISQASRRLPPEMTSLPTLRKVNPADSAVLYLAFSAKDLPLTQLDEYAETRVADRLSTLTGVAQVLVFGSQKYAVRIRLNPYALQARGLSVGQVVSAVQQGNSNTPSGTLEGSVRSYTVSADGQLDKAADYNRLVVAYINGAPVTLRDLGRAQDSVENDKQLSTFNGRPAIILAIKRQPGANTVEVVQRVLDLLPQIRAQLPGDARIEIMHNRAEFIRDSIHDVTFTLLLAVVLVVGVILMFLRNLRATAISALSLPTALIGTLAVMYLLGYSLDTLSLMALTLSVGFVVDDAIVVQENIVRHLERGEDRMQAVLTGTREIGFTVVSMTLSLVAVFIPILFLGGIIGRLFSEFAVTMGVAVLLSAVVSLTLTPMLASRYLRPQAEHGRLYHWFERVFDRSLEVYTRGLHWSVEHYRSTLVVAGALLLGSVWLFMVVPKGFVPTEDTGLIIGNTRAPEGVTFTELRGLQDRVAEIVRANPNVAGVMSSAGQGFGGTSGSNIGRLIIHLKPTSERRDAADQVIQELRRAVREVSGIRVFFRNPPAIRIGAFSSNSSFQYVLQGTDLDQLFAAGTDLERRLPSIPGVQDVNLDAELRNPQINVRIRRERASALGVSAGAIEQALYDSYGGRQISTIYGATDSYPVILQLAPRYQQDANALNALYVASKDGHLVPLSAVAEISPSVGPLSINHYAQLPSVTLSFNLAPGASLGEATQAVEQLAASTLPSGVTGTFAGEAQSFQSSMRDLPLLLAFTVVVIYMVLGILYEHFIHPLTILTALPLAGFGAALALLLFHQELNVFSFAGLILLVGLVKKNGIIMVDFALRIRRQRDVSPAEAIIEACRVRYRPIMMTTFAALLGTLPIALGLGAGAHSRQSLGIAVVGGLLFSQSLTLFVTPAFYVAMEHLTGRVGGRSAQTRLDDRSVDEV